MPTRKPSPTKTPSAHPRTASSDLTVDTANSVDGNGTIGAVEHEKPMVAPKLPPTLKKGTSRKRSAAVEPVIVPTFRRPELDAKVAEVIEEVREDVVDANGVACDEVIKANQDYPWNVGLPKAPTVRHGRLASVLAADPSLRRVLVEVVPHLSVACRMTLFVAREKSGKTTYLAFCATEVTLGTHHSEGGRVLWCGFEEPVSEAIHRFELMGADLSKICIMDRVDPDKVVQTITDEIRSFRPALVVIDSLSIIGAYMDLKEKSEEGWTIVINQLRQAAQDYGCGIVLIHHARKADGEFRGSTAIAASVDQVVTMHEDEKEALQRRLSCRGRWDIPNHLVTYSPTSNSFTRSDLAGESLAAEKDETITAALLQFVQQHPGTSKTSATTSVRGNAVKVRAIFDKMVDQQQVVNRPGERGWFAAGAEGDPSPE